jgi:endonuclease/exonuclease/phosphatase (EEP) superfamily protein YafD
VAVVADVVERPSTGRRWLRGAAATVAGLLVLVAALFLWAGALQLDLSPLFAQLYAFRVQAMAVLLGLGIVALLLARGRWRLWGLAAVLLALSPLPQVLPRVVGAAAPGAPALRVLAVNVKVSGADVDRVVALAVERQADVVALPEASEAYAAEVARRASAAGLDLVGGTDNPLVSSARENHSWRSGGPFPTSLLVRRDLEPEFDLQRPSATMGSLTADIRRAGAPLAVAAVHPAAPVPGGEVPWQVDHESLHNACATATPTVLVGDFNSTFDHTVMRGLLAAGCRDAAEITGNGLTGTWPSSAPWPLRVPIDHLLLNPAAGSVLSYEVVEVAGTDHLGTFTVLGPPAPR